MGREKGMTLSKRASFCIDKRERGQFSKALVTRVTRICFSYHISWVYKSIRPSGLVRYYEGQVLEKDLNFSFFEKGSSYNVIEMDEREHHRFVIRIRPSEKKIIFFCSLKISTHQRVFPTVESIAIRKELSIIRKRAASAPL